VIPDIDSLQQEILAEFSGLSDWEDRYGYLIRQGRELPSLPPPLRTEKNRLPGCRSSVWMVAELEGDQVHFHVHSDSAIIRGLIALLLRVLNYRRPEEILETDLYFLRESQLRSHLSPSRAHSLMTILNHLRSLANELSGPVR